MKPFRFNGIAQEAFLVCDDFSETIDKVRAEIINDASQPSLRVVDCSGIVSGKDLRLLLDDAAGADGQSANRVLIVHGIENIAESELRVGLEHFAAFINAYNDHLEDSFDISYKSYDYSFNPEGLSVLVLVKPGIHEHFLKYSRSIMGYALLT